MPDINLILESLNSNYPQITNLVPDIDYFVDDLRFAQDDFDKIYLDSPQGQKLFKLSNGKLIWTGLGGTKNSSKNVRRFDSSYALETAFVCPDFQTGTNGSVWAVGEQSDGKLIIGGTFTTLDGDNYRRIARLNTDGSVDSTFNEDGFGVLHTITAIATSSGGTTTITSVDHGLSSTENIVISGSNSTGSVNGTWQVTVTDADNFTIPSSVVTVAGTTGTFRRLSGSSSGFNNQVLDLKVLDDDSIIAVGQFTSYNGEAVPFVCKLTPDGLIDETFDASGVTELDALINTLVLDGEGSIYLGGNFTNKLIKVESDGSKDDNFYVGTGLDAAVNCLTLDADGKLLVGGNFDAYKGSACNPGIVRLSTAIGSTKSITDIAISDGGSSEITCNSHGLNSGDVILISSSNSTNDVDGYWEVNVLNSNVFTIEASDVSVAGTSGSFFKVGGTLDNTFQTEGSGIANSVAPTLLVKRFAIQTDGKIVVAGWFNRYNGSRQGNILRLNTNGTKDSSLNIGFGFNQLNDQESATVVNSILIDGDILVTGNIFAYNYKPVFAFARLSSTGTVKPTHLLKYKHIVGINDGSDDMYDGGNFLNTDLTQVFETIDRDAVTDSDLNQFLCIKNTHTPAVDAPSVFDESGVSMYQPWMDGEVKDADDYFGAGSQYFTNFYPGLFVLVATNVSVNEFSITGDVGSDEQTVNNSYFFVDVNGKTFSAFVKTNIEVPVDEEDIPDPSINQIIIIPGTPNVITQTINDDGEEYDDHLIRGISGRSEIYYLLVSREIGQHLELADAELIVQKFLSLIENTDEEITATFDCSPQVRNRATEGSLDTELDANGNSVQRTLNGVLVERNGQYKIIGEIKDGSQYNNTIQTLTDYLSIKEV